VILQWIQRAIVDNMGTGVLPIAPPILSRVFNELANGVVSVSAARKINELPFPFHYAQMLAIMLLVYTLGVPCAAGYVMESWWGAAGSTFLNVFVLWAVNYLAVEIESPFGDDTNDLPIHEEMDRMNQLLRMLIQGNAQTPPTYFQSRLSRAFTGFVDDTVIEDVTHVRPEAKIAAPAMVHPSVPDPSLCQKIPLPAEVPILVERKGGSQNVAQPAISAAFKTPEPKIQEMPRAATAGKLHTEHKSFGPRDGSRAFKKVPHDRLRHGAANTDEAELESCSDDERPMTSPHYSHGRSMRPPRGGYSQGKPPVPPVPDHLPK